MKEIENDSKPLNINDYHDVIKQIIILGKREISFTESEKAGFSKFISLMGLYKNKNQFTLQEKQQIREQCQKVQIRFGFHQNNQFFTIFEKQEEDIKYLFLEILNQGQLQDPSIKFGIIEQTFNEEGLEIYNKNSYCILGIFEKKKQVKSQSLQIFYQRNSKQKLIYCHLQKINNKNILKIFTLNHYSEIGTQIIELLRADDLFEQHIYSEFPRHNIFHECNEITLGAWYFMQTQSKMQPEEAMANLLFSLIPYNLIMTQEE